MKATLLITALSILSVAHHATAQVQPSVPYFVINIFNLNVSGADRSADQVSELVTLIRQKTADYEFNVMTLQEICFSQYQTILQDLQAFDDGRWSGSFRDFGSNEGCGPGSRHGLATFTRGQHTDLQQWDFPNMTYFHGAWGILKVNYRGVDIFNVHIQAGRRVSHTQIVQETVSQSPLAVVAGDFNSTPDETNSTTAALYEEWFELDVDRNATHWSGKIDYIWFTQWPVGSFWGDVLDAPSNHRAVLGSFVPMERTVIWDGGSASSGNWTADTNWERDVEPGAGDYLILPVDALRRVNTNNLASGTVFGGVTFQGDNYNIHGNTITLTNHITAASGTSNNIFRPSIRLGAPASIRTHGSGLQLTLLGNIDLNGHALTFDVSGEVVCSGVISGTGSITKTGPGRLIFGGISANTYSGSTTVSQGTLELSKYLLINPGAFRNGRVAVPGQLTVGTGAGPLIGVFVMCEAPSQLGNSAAVLVGANGELNLQGYSDTIGSLQMLGGHVTTGDGILTVTNDIRCAADPDGSTISGRLHLSAPTTLLNTEPDALLNLRATVSGAPANTELRKFGAGELRLHGTNAYTAMTRLVEGTTRVLSFGGLGAGGSQVRLESGQLILNNAAISNKTLVAWEPAALVTEGLTSRWIGDASLLGTIQLNTLGNSTLRFEGRMTGAGGWRKTGPGSWHLDGRVDDASELNTFTGGVRVEEGLLDVGVFLNGSNLYTLPGPLIVGTSNGEPASVYYGWRDQLADNAALVVEASGEVVDPDDLIGTLSGTGDVNMRAVTFRVGGTSVGPENLSTFAGRISGSGEFIKTGGGTLTLTGTNFFVGPTEVQQGTLLVQGELPTAFASRPREMTVHPGATLGGNGLVRELICNDANLSPGASPGILTVETVTLNGGSRLHIELNGPAPGTSYDRLATTSRVRLDAIAPPQLKVTAGYSPGVGDSFLILDNGGGTAISGTFAGLPEGAEFTAGHVRFHITYVGGTGNDVVLLVTEVAAAPSLLTGLNVLLDGSRQILGLGFSNLVYTIEATPHLNAPIPWTAIGTTPAGSGGLYQFLDTNAPLFPMRFYRAVSP